MCNILCSLGMSNSRTLMCEHKIAMNVQIGIHVVSKNGIDQCGFQNYVQFEYVWSQLCETRVCTSGNGTSAIQPICILKIIQLYQFRRPVHMDSFHINFSFLSDELLLGCGSWIQIVIQRLGNLDLFRWSLKISIGILEYWPK